MTTTSGVLSLFLVGFTCLFLYLYKLFWWKPLRLRKKLRHQNGPGPSFFFGNNPYIKKIQLEIQAVKNQQSNGNHVCHDYMAPLFPRIKKWRADYGKIEQRLLVTIGG